MRDGITPQWEDTKNLNGGCLSFKVSNENADTLSLPHSKISRRLEARS